MTDQMKLMCVLAHPDDESLGVGGILAKSADEGVTTSLLTATRGERGWFGREDEYPGPDRLAARREEELQAAAAELGLHEVSLLGYEDGRLDQADPQAAIGEIAAHVRRFRPQVVVTFGPFGSYGHPDHIAVCQLTTAAVVAAAAPGDGDLEHPPHAVSKLYYFVETRDLFDAYEEVFGELVMEIDGEVRRAPGWPPWAITTRIDSVDCWRQVWRAVACHRSQLPGYQAILDLPEERLKGLWATQSFYRAFSRVNGGRAVERDLFAGLR